MVTFELAGQGETEKREAEQASGGMETRRRQEGLGKWKRLVESEGVKRWCFIHLKTSISQWGCLNGDVLKQAWVLWSLGH